MDLLKWLVYLYFLHISWKYIHLKGCVFLMKSRKKVLKNKNVSEKFQDYKGLKIANPDICADPVPGTQCCNLPSSQNLQAADPILKRDWYWHKCVTFFSLTIHIKYISDLNYFSEAGFFTVYSRNWFCLPSYQAGRISGKILSDGPATQREEIA